MNLVPTMVPCLQALSGLAWLVTSGYITPRIIRACGPNATRGELLAAPVGFVGWLQVGFSVRWLVWRAAVHDMVLPELITWASLYALSTLVAVWVLKCARMTRND